MPREFPIAQSARRSLTRPPARPRTRTSHALALAACEPVPALPRIAHRNLSGPPGAPQPNTFADRHD
eukprot:3146631-Prymnesium_polylepis.1